jgi:dTDP-6-deoxy-L-talose 4-dehydrogenase (NAD+)
MNRRVLVTGATGFVGMQVLKVLQTKKVDIILIARPGYKSKLQTQARITGVFETNNLFLESSEWWKKACKGIDTIIHVAWYAEPGKYLLSDKNIECLQGTLNLANGAAAAGVRRIVGIGTCFEYSLVECPMSINTPLDPTTPYAASKVATYLVLLQLLKCKNVEFAWCRLFYLYGEGEDDRRLVPYIKLRLESNQPVELTSGTQIRDYMNVSDAGEMIVDTAFNNIQGAINICSGIPITVRQLAEEIADEYGKKELLQFGKKANNITDPSCIVGVI